MINELNINGSLNFAQQNTENSTINVIINKSLDYNKLLSDLSDLENYLSDIDGQPSKEERINQLKNKIFQKQREIEQFKEEVIRLAEAFYRIEVDTGRLKLAKKYFEEGQFKEADSILKLKEIDTDQTILLSAKERKEKELEEIRKHLIDNSNEYFIKAQVTKLYNYKSNKFGEIFRLFKKSIQSYSSIDNNYALALFFIQNQKHSAALPYLLEALNYRIDANNVDLGKVLNAIGLCYKEEGKYDQAEKYYIECLELLKNNIKYTDRDSMHDLAITNMNLGVLYADWKKFDKDLPFLEEALNIYRKFPIDSNKYRDDLASCLNNIGKHYMDSDDKDIDKVLTYLEEALELRREASILEPINYSFRIANILANLTMSYMEKLDFIKAEKCLNEAIARYESYEKMGIYSYRQTFLFTLVNGAIFYADHYKKRKEALYLAERAFQILKITSTTERLRIRTINTVKRIYNIFNERLPN